jgi:hypothetical protein
LLLLLVLLLLLLLLLLFVNLFCIPSRQPTCFCSAIWEGGYQSPVGVSSLY